MQIHKIFITSVSLFVILGFSGCGGGSGAGFFGSTTGTLSLNLADAPLVDKENVTGVYITVSRIEYHASGDGWKTMEDFNTSVNPINLLQWQDGKSISLGDFQMPAGKYTQIRFMLDAAEENQKPQTNTGCFIEINDANHTLYVPSGTRYDGNGEYETYYIETGAVVDSGETTIFNRIL